MDPNPHGAAPLLYRGGASPDVYPGHTQGVDVDERGSPQWAPRNGVSYDMGGGAVAANHHGTGPEGSVVYSVQDTSTQTKTQETEFGGVLTITTTTVTRTITERIVASDEEDSDDDEEDGDDNNSGNMGVARTAGRGGQQQRLSHKPQQQQPIRGAPSSSGVHRGNEPVASRAPVGRYAYPPPPLQQNGRPHRGHNSSDENRSAARAPPPPHSQGAPVAAAPHRDSGSHSGPHRSPQPQSPSPNHRYPNESQSHTGSGLDNTLYESGSQLPTPKRFRWKQYPMYDSTRRLSEGNRTPSPGLDASC